jgi:4,5-DOPA dioxygenase extradiol
VSSHAATRMPVLYLSHGAPPLADDALWTGQLAAWSAALPRPRAVLIVSAHWESAPVTLGATRTVPLVHDFRGFPERYSAVRYAAPGAPELAARVRGLLGGRGTPVHDDPGRGLDHGAYVPLVEMYPDADVPVLQLSMPTLDPEALMALGRGLAPLREEGVLIIGSGFFTHNLKGLMWGAGPEDAQSWSKEFDRWCRRSRRPSPPRCTDRGRRGRRRYRRRCSHRRRRRTRWRCPRCSTPPAPSAAR